MPFWFIGTHIMYPKYNIQLNYCCSKCHVFKWDNPNRALVRNMVHLLLYCYALIKSEEAAQTEQETIPNNITDYPQHYES